MNKGPPPPGGDQDQAGKYVTTTAVLASISVAIVALRFIARSAGGKRFGWDDWTMLAALVRSLSTNTSHSLNRVLRRMIVSCCSRFWSRRDRDTCWLGTAYLLLGPRTSHSSWESVVRCRNLGQLDYLFGEAICGIISTKDRGFAKVASGCTICHHRPLDQLYFCDCHRPLRAVQAYCWELGSQGNFESQLPFHFSIGRCFILLSWFGT